MSGRYDRWCIRTRIATEGTLHQQHLMWIIILRKVVADEEEVCKEEQAFMPGCNLIQTMMGIIHHVVILMTCTPIIILRHERKKQTTRASHTNYRRQSDHLASCPSGLHRRATFQADEPPSKINLARPTTTTTSVQPRSILRRGSSFNIKTKHQHHHVSPNKNSHRASDSTDAYELSSIEDDNESESSSDTESPQTSKPPADVAVQDDVKKIVLPGFDDVRFNEQSLLKAFSDIAKAKK